MAFLLNDNPPWPKDFDKRTRDIVEKTMRGKAGAAGEQAGADARPESKCFLLLTSASGEAIAGEALGNEVHNEAAKDLIRIASWNWGLGVSAEHLQGESYSRGPASPEQFSFKHSMDVSTTTLLAYLSAGTKFHSMKFKEFRSTSKESGGQFELSVLIELTDVFVTSVKIDNAGQAVPNLDINLMFDSIAFEYYPFSAEGVRQGGPPRRYQWKPQISTVLLNGRPFEPD